MPPTSPPAMGPVSLKTGRQISVSLFILSHQGEAHEQRESGYPPAKKPAVTKDRICWHSSLQNPEK